MSLRSLESRLRCLEALQAVPDRPTLVLSSRPLEKGEARLLLEHWREEVDAGRASRYGHALYIRSPVLSREEWIATYCRPELARQEGRP
jgi:hypothetical protein